ncbi:MAG TPA: ammonia-forming cytochrome c nitrite reductase subunit c552 [Spirochaetota bacterium]|nr:ammonia-forming cytochrome c nitrite reductase subunit c552 [Spirochaetota bacterium]
MNFKLQNNKMIILVAFIAGIMISTAIAALLTDIFENIQEGRRYPLTMYPLSDDDINPETWGKNFPLHYEDYLKMKNENTPTNFGGSLPYSKLIRYPQLTRLWAGYAFAADFNEERTHFYAQVDQRETFRTNRAWLNKHGFPKFKGQPGACMNCHSSWAPKLIRQLGWIRFNNTPYFDLVAMLDKAHGKSQYGSQLGGACSDCHSPKDMSLRITRPAYINAMIARGYAADPEHGIVASRAEMRGHVCQQCHVEYYFKKGTNELTFPWNQWPKGTPLRIEMIESYYDAIRNLFSGDWVHSLTGAPMIKIQHPETELFSSGIHARSGVTCTDCHMPYRRSGGVKITDHNITSPMKNLEGTCGSCHPLSTEELKARIDIIQFKTALALRATEKAILALVDDIMKAKSSIISMKSTAAPQLIETALKVPREFHRRAQMRWDFIFSENSTGFHSPQESMRVLAQAVELSRQGQLALQGNLIKMKLSLAPTIGSGKIPAPGKPIPERHSPAGDPPPQKLLLFDRTVQ